MVGVQTDMFAQESKIVIAVMRLFVRKVSDLATHLESLTRADIVFFAQGNHVKRSVTVQLQPLSDRFTRSHHSFQQQRHGRKARNVDIHTSIESEGSDSRFKLHFSVSAGSWTALCTQYRMVSEPFRRGLGVYSN